LVWGLGLNYFFMPRQNLQYTATVWQLNREVKMAVSKEIACLSVSARLLSRKDVKNHD